MTLLYMTIDTDNGHLRWVRAGHDPAVLYDPVQDQFEELKGAGLALGLDEKFTYEENVRTELTSGHIIAIGTDGIWEAFNGDGEMYGKKRFHRIIRHNARLEANDILNAIYDDLDSFRSGRKAEDDITLVVIKITSPIRFSSSDFASSPWYKKCKILTSACRSCHPKHECNAAFSLIIWDHI
jgi:sigma-B regulation protein RsbU (phosphoserine phosphatase)